MTALAHTRLRLLTCGALLIPSLAAAQSHLTHLRVDALDTPLGLDAEHPHFSWQIADPRQDAKQTAYHILVASRPELLADGKADIWDSGKIDADHSINVAYAGPTLKPRQRYYWNVRAWDQSGTPSPAATSWWETGLMHPKWPAAWITSPDTSNHAPVPLLRSTFTLAKPIAQARVYATALGTYRLSLNGTRVGQDLLTPDWTDYRIRVTYQTYDVTSLLHRGPNAIGAWLGKGWYGGPLGWEVGDFVFGAQPPRLSVALYVRYTDGSESLITSDSSWTTHESPIESAELYNGERYDARHEIDGWDRPGFDARRWTPARVVATSDTIRVTGQASPTIRETRTVHPVRHFSPKPGTYIYDIGQNLAGWVRLRVQGPAGTVVQLRFAEVLDSAGTGIYRDNLRKAEATDSYTLRGHGTEVFEPRFTYHGFRFVEVTGYPGTPPDDAITAVVLNTDASETMRFTTSDSVINRLWENIRWSQRANFYSVPTDCPQRDERLGWMGDAQVFWRTATFNMDLQAFTRKWLTDVRDGRIGDCYNNIAPRLDPPIAPCGGAGWADAGVIVTWTAARQYGDTQVVHENWAAMDAYLTSIRANNPDFIRKNTQAFEFADWLPADATVPTTKTAPALVATAYWAYDAQAMEMMARQLGRTADAERYHAIADSVRTAFVRAFVHSDGSVGKAFTNHDGVASDVTQTSLVMGLHPSLVPDSQRTAAVARLVRDITDHHDHLTTGFLGTAWLMNTLSESGQDSVAYRLLFQDTRPSWLYMIKHGATTMWERWNGDTGDRTMNSYNHYAFGAVGEWMYRFMVGIDADSAGYHAIRIQPRPNARLSHVHGEYDSPYGTIVSDWTLVNGTFTLSTTIPANTTATIVMPMGETHKVGAGTYRYSVQMTH